MKTYLIATVMLLTAARVQSQGIVNVDLYRTQLSSNPPYGPGAGAIGSSGDYWNGFNSYTQATINNLKNSDGTVTSVGFTLGLIGGLIGGNPGGTYGLLFDDTESPATGPNGHGSQITGLTPGGLYDLYLYAAGNTSGINVNGTVFSSADTYSFSAYNSLVLGTEYDEHTVIADGSGDLTMTTVGSDSGYSAFQLEAIPEPSTLALAALGASLLVAARAKRRLL